MLKTVSSITNAIGALNYKGTWNASTNSPALASGVGTKGDYYVVSVAGATNLDGETLWGVGDWAVFNGTAWQRLEGGSTINATTVTAVDITTTGNTILGNASTDTLNVGNGGLVKDASGNVGINTASPAVKLDIQGAGGALSAVNPPLQVWDTTALAANIGGGIAFGGNYTGSTKTNWAGIAGLKDNAVDGEFGGYLALYTRANGGGNVERMRIASNGIVTMSAYGAGAATFSAAGVISSVSDETWKTKDGVPLNPDAMLKKLEPGYWFYNEEKAPIFGADRQLGFYAQNVNYAIGVEAAPIPETYSEIDKNGVETIKTKPWGYYDRSVLAVTVMSLQKALATIESLTARLEVLEGK